LLRLWAFDDFCFKICEERFALRMLLRMLLKEGSLVQSSNKDIRERARDNRDILWKKLFPKLGFPHKNFAAFWQKALRDVV